MSTATSHSNTAEQLFQPYPTPIFKNYKQHKAMPSDLAQAAPPTPIHNIFIGKPKHCHYPII